MQKPTNLDTSRNRRHRRAEPELLAALSIALMAVLAYALWPRPAPPVETAAVPAAAPGSEFSDAHKHEAELKRLANLNEQLYPSDQMVQQTDQQLDREERLQERRAAAAVQLQEDLKDLWLERRSVTANPPAADPAANAAVQGPISQGLQCDAVCRQGFIDLGVIPPPVTQ